MFSAYHRIGENRYRQRIGLDFEDFSPGQRFRHRPGVTLSQQDNADEALDTLKKNFKDVCLDPIHFAIKVKEAPSMGKTLFEYAPNSSAAGDYWRVIERLMQVESARDEAGLAGGLG